jgi:hypothetical protein
MTPGLTRASSADRGKVKFQARLLRIGSWTLLRLPKAASAKLPSRGMVMVEGTMNGFHFRGPLEPDGKRGHWLRVGKDMLEGAKAGPGDTVSLVMSVSEEWPEPPMPEDLHKGLSSSDKAYATWKDVSTGARWDWIRWIRATKNPGTRRKRVEVALSKLGAGDRRPCCFNRSSCTETAVSSNGVLLEE